MTQPLVSRADVEAGGHRMGRFASPNPAPFWPAEWEDHPGLTLTQQLFVTEYRHLRAWYDSIPDIAQAMGKTLNNFQRTTTRLHESLARINR